MPEIANAFSPVILIPSSVVAKFTWAHDTAYLSMLSKLLCGNTEGLGSGKWHVNESTLERKGRYPPFLSFVSL